MYVDTQLLLSDAQAVGAITNGNFVYSTNWIDLVSPITDRDIGNGIPIYLVSVVTTIMVTASATVAIALLSDATDAAMDSGSTIHPTLGTFPAESAVGTTMVMPIPPLSEVGNLLRYIGVSYGAVGANLGSASFDTFITNTPQAYKSYAKSYTISS